MGGATARVLRLSYVGEKGYEMHVPWSQAGSVLEAIRRATSVSVSIVYSQSHGVTLWQVSAHAGTFWQKKIYRQKH